MDIGAANRGNGRKNGGVHNVNAGSNQGKTQGKTQESQAGRPPVNKDQCLRCKGFGHWKNECPNNRRRGPQGGGGSVNHVGSGPAEEEEDEEDSDDSEDWVGCATLSSGNSKGQA